MNYTFSDKIASLKPSAIREILKATQNPEIIPLAAGNPAPEAFPTEDIQNITKDILANQPITALQYGVTEGYVPLRAALKARLKEKENIGQDFDEILITSGAQQVMDLTSKILLNEGDVVICERPSFVGSLNCFRSYNAKLYGIDVDADGMNMEQLEDALKTQKNVKMIYTIPTFQNPAGATMSLAKRKRLYELAKQYNIPVLEDNPYGDLRAHGEHVPTIKSMDTEGLVIYAGSFSKILSPGMRVGYAVAPKELVAKMTVGKQASDVHTTQLMQMIVHEWLTKYDVDAHLSFLQDIYRERLNLMCDTIDESLGDVVHYYRPEGGLFVWATLPDEIPMFDFVKAAVKEKVAVVPGTAFMMSDEEPTQSFRMNFSTPSKDRIVEGITLLGKVAKQF